MRDLTGAALAALVALLARRARALTPNGSLAAFAVGSIVYGTSGWRGTSVLFAFFIPSTLLSRMGRNRKRALQTAGKHGPRDAAQVLANGGVAAACALLSRNARTPLRAAFAGAFAAAAADTWGTEIGTLSATQPRSILTFQPVATGLSGGVTVAGTVATLAGAVCVATVSQLTGVAPFWPVVAGGVAGAFLDSFLGASLQALRWCQRCARACETNPHACGSPTVLRRGYQWIDNDVINVTATLGGALVAGSLAARS